MTKGTSDGRTKVAGTAKSAVGTKAQDDKHQDDGALLARPARLRKARTDNSVEHTDNPGTEGQAAARTRIEVRSDDAEPAKTARSRSKRLTGESVERLFAASISDELDEHELIGQPPNKVPDATARILIQQSESYDAGFDAGYAAAEAEMCIQHASEVTPLSFKLWQGMALVLLGILIGLIF